MSYVDLVEEKLGKISDWEVGGLLLVKRPPSQGDEPEWILRCFEVVRGPVMSAGGLVSGHCGFTEIQVARRICLAYGWVSSRLARGY
jgi:hypothetical protein